jgi:general stress protein 26
MKKYALAHLAAALLIPLLASGAGAELSAETRQALVDADLIYTATDRKDGSVSTVAPIWFWYDGESDFLYTTTSPESWKAKRIARGSPLHIWVGEEDGPYFLGEPESLTDAATIDRVGDAYADKYFIAWLGFFRPRSERVADGRTLAYKVHLHDAPAPVPADD